MEQESSDRRFSSPLEHSLALLLFQYSALVAVKDISFPLDAPFAAVHGFLLRNILLNHHLRQYPPSELYQQGFWKWALVQLEDLCQSHEENEIDERIYTHYLSLRTSLGSEAPSSSFITRYWRFPEANAHAIEVESYETITLLESRTTIEAGTTGFRTWRASLALAQYLIHYPCLVDTCNVLELGSGTGFIGILVASLQLHATTTSSHKKPSVYLTDVNSSVLARCQSNVRLPCNKSSCHSSIHYKSLDWLDSFSDQERLTSLLDEAKSDILLGADIVFDPVLVPPLVGTISLALSSERARLALIALTLRNENTFTYFLDEIGKVLRIEEVAYDIAGHVLLQTPDQIDADLEAKIFKVTRAEDAC